MKFILAAFAIVILLSSSVEAADLDFVEQKHVAPPRLHRPFLPPMKTPQKDYVPRRSFRPTPHFSPHVPKPSNDNRGGKRKNFSPPRSPHR
ncbi:MAG: hypothetical protein SR3Q1_08250 [Quinella sp. 3Q1]|nr:hypothetical protein [Quinella sp. 3Q1]